MLAMTVKSQNKQKRNVKTILPPIGLQFHDNDFRAIKSGNAVECYAPKPGTSYACIQLRSAALQKHESTLLHTYVQ